MHENCKWVHIRRRSTEGQWGQHPSSAAPVALCSEEFEQQRHDKDKDKHNNNQNDKGGTCRGNKRELLYKKTGRRLSSRERYNINKPAAHQQLCVILDWHGCAKFGPNEKCYPLLTTDNKLLIWTCPLLDTFR